MHNVKLTLSDWLWSQKANDEVRVRYKKQDAQVGAQAGCGHFNLSTPLAEAGESLWI